LKIQGSPVVCGDANTEENKQKILSHSSNFDLIIDEVSSIFTTSFAYSHIILSSQ